MLIANEHLMVRIGLQDMLPSQPDFEMVAEAIKGVEVVELTDQLHPNIVTYLCLRGGTE